MTLPPETWSPSPKRTHLLLVVLVVLSCLSGRAAHAQTPSVIDVAVFYTPAAKNHQGGTAQIEAKIDEIITETNTAYTDSGVNQRLNLVAAEEVRYTEGQNVDVDYRRLRDPSDGHMDEVHTIRERVWADIVMLLSYRAPRGGPGGAAIRPYPISAPDVPDYAFGVVVINRTLDDLGVVEYSSTMRFAHELGHIMGLDHDRYEECHAGRCPRIDYPYAYGYVNQEAFTDGAATSKRWRTIMSYPNQCRDAGFTCDMILRFSNPSQTYRGDPLGKSGTQDTTAVDGPADAVRALNNNRETVARFRPGRGVTVTFDAAIYTATEDGTAATVTVQLNLAPGRELVIPLTTASAGGAWPHDYTITMPESVTFSATQTERTLTITAVSDDIDETDETLTLGFGTLPPGVTAGDRVSATVTLEDNDTKAGAPSVDNVAITSEPGLSGAYGVNEEIEVTVRFDKHVSVTGTPQIGLTIGENTRQARYQAARSAGEVLVFTYTVMDGESDTDGISIAANSLTLNRGTIKDAANQDAIRTHDAVAADSGHPVEGVKPVLQTATVDGNIVTLTYNETLRSNSTPAATAFTLTAGARTPAVRSVRVSGRTVRLTLNSYVTQNQTVTLSYTSPAAQPIRDASGNAAESFSNQAVTNTTPEPFYDTDDDGLLEIMTLAQLNAIRHDLNGDGRPTSAGRTAYFAAFEDAPTTDGRLACGTSRGCMGYELDADLDFDINGDGRIDADDAYWNRGAGWQPIGTSSTAFNATFEGNGHTVSGLFIKRSTTEEVGLFSSIGSSGAIRNVGVVDVDVTGRGDVGGLVGESFGSITTSYATGRVTGSSAVGGLVGRSFGSITTSYATGRVMGSSAVGGLVGAVTGNRAITTSYATGRVTGSSAVGGLVGEIVGSITTSYATGRVTGSRRVGGLVGAGFEAAPNNYWDTSTSGQTSSTGGTGKTTAELQVLKDGSGIYADWDADQWAFAAGQYPALKADFDGDGTATWQEFGHQLRTGPTSLTVTTSTGLVELSWTAVSTTAWSPAPDVTYTVYRTTGSTVTAVAEDLTASAYTDRTVTRGTTYTYQVAAVVDGGEATWSAPGEEVTAPTSRRPLMTGTTPPAPSRRTPPAISAPR